jgi:hypothetical protein
MPMNSNKNALLHWFPIFIAFIAPALVYAQQNNYHLNIRTDFSIPHIRSNTALANSFRGTYDVTPSLNIPLFAGFYVGGTYKLFTASDKLGLRTKQKAQITISGPGVKLGWDKPVGETAVFTTGITYGTSNIHFKYLPSDTMPPSYKSVYIEPSLGFVFYIETNFAIGFDLTYCIYENYTFDPYRIAFDPYKGYSNEEVHGNTQYLNLGFGFIYTFWKKKGKE